MQDYHILPKLRDSLSYLYIEHAVIQRYRQSVEKVDQEGRIALPIAALSVLLLGPGTRITHEAIKLLADNGCSILWVGENGTKFYAQGMGETRKARRLLHQARLVSDVEAHRAVAMATDRFTKSSADATRSWTRTTVTSSAASPPGTARNFTVGRLPVASPTTCTK